MGGECYFRYVTPELKCSSSTFSVFPKNTQNEQRVEDLAELESSTIPNFSSFELLKLGIVLDSSSYDYNPNV